MSLFCSALDFSYLCSGEKDKEIMTTVAMNSLWEYLQSLSLSKRNRKWLAERLIAFDDTKVNDVTKTAGFKEALDDAKNGRVTHYDSLKDFYKEMGL